MAASVGLVQLVRQLGVAMRLRALRGHLQVADDAGQDVVEVVGDAAGQLADRLHLLRLPQLGLELGMLGFGASARTDVARRPKAHAARPDG